MAVDVIGREAELDSVRAFLASVGHGPAALVLSGDPGIGKSTLWETGVDEARDGFAEVLTCRGVEAEASFAFAGLTELLAGVIRDAAPGLAPPRRRALEVALQLEEPGETAPDAHVIGLAVLDVWQGLAENGPVLVALDDVQWLDSASAAVLSVAVHRLRDQRIGVLAAVRLSTDTTRTLELERSFRGALIRLDLHPLSLGALHELLKQRLGLELTRGELSRVKEASGGNPFFAIELGRELVRTNTRPTTGRALRVPDTLHELLGGRLARLPEETLDVLLQVAALARPTVELLATVQGDRGHVLEALETAVREGVVELDESSVRFAHPLIASLCYDQAPVWKRRAAHRELASSVTDTEERASHLALAADGPDAVAARYLDAAAEHAAARGAPTAAAELSELAADLTPDDPALARERRFRAASFHRLAGDSERAGVMLEQLLEEAEPGGERADVLFALAMMLQVERFPLFEEALAEAEGDDARSARILANRSGIRLYEVNGHAALTDARAALETAERVDDPVLLKAVIARVATVEGYATEFTPGLLERGVELEERLGLGSFSYYYESPRYLLVRLLMRLGELERPRALLEKLDAETVARGDEITRVMLLWTRGMLEWLAGRWHVALDHARAARELGEQSQSVHGRIWVARIQALVEADLGLVEGARASAAEGLSYSKGVSEFHTMMGLASLGHLELALGNLDAAGSYLRELPERLVAGEMADPTLPVWADAVETLIALAELDKARAYLEQYEANALRLGSPGTIACAARCRGLICAAENDFEEAFRAFERALVEPPEPWPFERGRTLLCLGTVRRQAQQKKTARDALDQALAIFEELGARLWAEKAHAELRRISGRRPADEELTETERRVADLAAVGRSNKEIAAELFMGVSTVEAHLSRVYRKLGIRSRAGLAGRLAATVAAADEA
jgi:ATP/maltotriose-dependent transcriptional regulator MalT